MTASTSTHRWVARLLALAVGAVLTTGAALTPPAGAATAEFPYNVSIKGGYGTAEVAVAIPAGTRPRLLTATIDSSYTTPGDLTVLVNGTVASTVPAIDGGDVEVALGADDVRAGEVTVGLRADLDPTQDCLRDDEAVASMRDAQLVLTGTPQAPTTIADFLAPGAAAYTVAVPASPTAGEQEAGLDAVLALRHLATASTSVSLVVTDDPPPTAGGNRTVVVEEDGSQPNRMALDDAALILTGDGESLPAAAVALADPNAGLMQVTEVSNMSAPADYHPFSGTATLAELGVESLSVTGIGSVSQVVTVPQAAFGSPVSQFIVDLTGAATPVLPGQQGRVDIRWNDTLVASQVLTGDSRLHLRFTVPAQTLRAVNAMETQLRFLPAGGDCSNPPLPGQAQIDVDSSTLTATLGESAGPGFQRFPQAFEAQIPVAVTSALAQSLPHAAQLLAAAVAPSPWQYTVAMTEVSSLGGRGGLGVGVDPQQAAELGAPLPDDQDGGDFPAGRAADYAALQAFESSGRNVILLSAQPSRAAAQLAAWPQEQPTGWSGLTGQVYVTSPASPTPQAFDTPSTAPDKRTPQLIAAAAASAVLLLVLAVWLWRRPRQR